MTPADVAAQFESLGGGSLHSNGWAFGCEFGFWQRSLGLEPMGLLRWASINPDGLCRGLEAGFAGVDDPQAIKLREHTAEDWGMTQITYGIYLDHSGMRRQDTTPDQAIESLSRTLRFMRRKLLEDLACGDKLFVYRTYDHTLDEMTLTRITSALSCFPNATLLYVDRALAKDAAFTAEKRQTNLIIGYIDRFAPEAGGLNYNPKGWEAVCRSALAVWPRSNVKRVGAVESLQTEDEESDGTTTVIGAATHVHRSVKPKIHIHGNCQSMVMAAMLRELCPDWNITYFEVHADPIIERNGDYRSAIRSADIILTQPIHKGYRNRDDLCTNWVKAEARPGSTIVVIPAMHFEGHHPGYAMLGLGDLCANSLAAHLIAAGQSPAATVDILLSLRLLGEAFVRQEIRASIAEMATRELADEIDIPLSPIADYIQCSTQMFHIVNHPGRPLYAYVLNRVLEFLSLTQSRISVSGEDYQSTPHIPMLPAVAYHCRPSKDMPAAWATDQDWTVRVPQHAPMTQRLYYQRMTEQLSLHPAEKILSAIRSNPRTVAFLERLSTSNASIPGIERWATV